MEPTRETTVLVVEDDPLLRMGLIGLLTENEGFLVVGEAADGERAVELALRLRPRVVLMDISLPAMSGIEATRRIKDRLPATKILIVSMSDDEEDIAAAMAAGMDGYCLKTLAGKVLLEAVRWVASGHAWIDPAIAEKVLHASARLYASQEHEDLREKGATVAAESDEEGTAEQSSPPGSNNLLES